MLPTRPPRAFAPVSCAYRARLLAVSAAPIAQVPADDNRAKVGAPWRGRMAQAVKKNGSRWTLARPRCTPVAIIRPKRARDRSRRAHHDRFGAGPRRPPPPSPPGRPMEGRQPQRDRQRSLEKNPGVSTRCVRIRQHRCRPVMADSSDSELAADTGTLARMVCRSSSSSDRMVPHASAEE